MPEAIPVVSRTAALRYHAKRTLHAFGFYRRRLVAHPYHGVAVLTYHGVRDDRWPAGTMHFEELHVTARRLAEHCALLRELRCTLLSAGDWQQIASGSRPLPPRAVMLTFDDGYRTVLTQALPILERYNTPAVVFACTGPIEAGTRFWFDAVAQAGGEPAVESAKTLAHSPWQETIRRAAMATSPGDPHAPLTIGELRQLARHPLITIGAHTVTHPILRSAPPTVQNYEIAASKARLETWLECRVTMFAYPNGRPGIDYDATAVEAVGRAGLAHAFTTAGRFADPAGSRLEQPRFTMLQGVSGTELAHRLAISWRPVGHQVS